MKWKGASTENYLLPLPIVSASFMNSFQVIVFKVMHDAKIAVIPIFAAYYAFEANDAND